MSAVRYDSVFRYQVDSNSRHETKHLVELDAYDGNSRCSCEHFTFKLEALCNAPGFKPSDATRCRHIREARGQFCDDVIELLKKRQGEPPEHK